MTTLRSIRHAARAALVGLALLAGAGAAHAAGNDVNTDAGGVVLHGYDPVAYFTDHKAVQGKTEYSATYNGGTYHFATAAHRDSFAKEPAKYAPQFGGFCAFGASIEKKFDVDPEAFAVVDGKLYVNLNKEILSRFEGDRAGTITKANANWPQIKDKPAAEVNKLN